MFKFFYICLLYKFLYIYYNIMLQYIAIDDYMKKYEYSISKPGREEKGCYCDPKMNPPYICNIFYSPNNNVIECSKCRKKLFEPEKLIFYSK